MNVEIGTEAAQFPEKEYINGIFVAVRRWRTCASIISGRERFRTDHLCTQCEGRLGKCVLECVNVQMSVMSSRIPDRKIA